MPQITHRAFIVQPNGVIYVGDGTNEASFNSIAAFQQHEEGFALPQGIVAVGYEVRGERVAAYVQATDGTVTPSSEPNETYEGYIDSAEDYAAMLAEQAHPLYGLGVTAARDVTALRVAAELNTRADTYFARWPAAERNTFERQLAEATAWDADNQEPTPLIDAIILPSETKQEVVDNIIARASAWTMAIGAMMNVKRAKLEAVYDLDTLPALRNYYDNEMGTDWPALPNP